MRRFGLAAAVLACSILSASAQAPQPASPAPAQPLPPASTAPGQPGAAPRAPAAAPAPRTAAPTPATPGSEARRALTYRLCVRASKRRGLRGAQRRAFVTRCRIGRENVGR